MSTVIDLDILRPSPKFIKLGGKEIDVSFIPCAITFDIASKFDALSKLDQEKLNDGDSEEGLKAYNLAIDICALFCEHTHPEMSNDWFMGNTNSQQVQKFVAVLRETLVESTKGAEEYGKN